MINRTSLTIVSIIIATWILLAMLLTPNTLDGTFIAAGQSVLLTPGPFHITVNTPLGAKAIECRTNDPSCLAIRNAIVEILALEDPRTDRILSRYKIRVRDTNTITLYPRPE